MSVFNDQPRDVVKMLLHHEKRLDSHRWLMIMILVLQFLIFLFMVR